MTALLIVSVVCFAAAGAVWVAPIFVNWMLGRLVNRVNRQVADFQARRAELRAEMEPLLRQLQERQSKPSNDNTDRSER